MAAKCANHSATWAGPICAAVDKISTDMARLAVPLQLLSSQLLLYLTEKSDIRFISENDDFECKNSNEYCTAEKSLKFSTTTASAMENGQ